MVEVRVLYITMLKMTNNHQRLLGFKINDDGCAGLLCDRRVTKTVKTFWFLNTLFCFREKKSY